VIDAITLPALWTEKDAAEYLGVSEATVARQRRAGRIRYIRVGRHVRFRVDQVKAFAQGATVEPPTVMWPAIELLPIGQLRLLPDPLTRDDMYACEPGVYFLWLGGDLVYIGQSRSVGERVSHHRLNRDNSRDVTTSKVWGRPIEFDAQTWLAVPWPYQLAVEAAYIERLLPIENRRR
jgi:excisionase family DNA binding protein